MDLVLHMANECGLDSAWTALLPKCAPSRDNVWRQAISVSRYRRGELANQSSTLFAWKESAYYDKKLSAQSLAAGQLYVITLLGVLALYFGIAIPSYCFRCESSPFDDVASCFCSA